MNSSNALNESSIENAIEYTLVFDKLFPIAFGIITFLGLITNIYVIVIIFAYKNLRNTFNYIIVNLAIADLSFVCICPPLTAYYYVAQQWLLGDVLCKFMHYMINVTVNVSIYSLVEISLFRYIMITFNYNKQIQSMSPFKVFIICLLTWIIFGIAYIPIILSVKTNKTNNVIRCDLISDNYRQAINLVNLVFSYIVPLILTTIFSIKIIIKIQQGQKSMKTVKKTSYIRNKKATHVIILMLLIFFLTWMPIQIHLILTIHFDYYFNSKFYFIFIGFCHILAYSNSIVNPIIYSHHNNEFQNGLVKLWQGCKGLFCKK
ncbi:hypothetical protein A3Q56_01681 [Intoshia linei]|uniref:G-protein coupled receptors family 1 profile domain-containing protein n=1 Tax=Intoshia linei TaxID=1819745 RepID=A0A177B8L8_9BILA|nr:hypothetical protein A3Q56_01681 [Intoshia linei]